MNKQEVDTIMTILRSIPVSPGHFPKIAEISEKLNIPKYRVTKKLKQLVEIGYLKKKGENWYDFVDNDISKKTLEVMDHSIDNYKKGIVAGPINLEIIEEDIDYDLKRFMDNKDEKTYFDNKNKIAYQKMEEITEENKHDSIEVDTPWLEETANISKENWDKLKNKVLPKSWQKGLDKYNEEKELGDLTVIPIKHKIETFSILRIVMLILGISSGVVSAYYTQIWQHETLNIFWSWFLSLIMIGFSSAAFLTLIGLITKNISNKWSTWGLSIIFFLLWIICLIYSIQVTVAGRFAQYQEIVMNNSIKDNTENINKIKVTTLIESIDNLKNDRIINKKRLDDLIVASGYLQVGMEVKGETYKGIQDKISLVQKQLVDIDTKLENKNSEYQKLLSSSTIITNEKKFGFYDWAAKIYKTDKGNVEWIMLLFPSLFLDIASPIALAVFMFLGRRKDE